MLWCDRNIGAIDIYDSGKLFQWGDTIGYTADQVGTGEGQKAFSWNDYKWGVYNSSDSTNKGMTKYNKTDGKTVLDPEDDAAHVNMGGNWRMPTYEEIRTLFSETIQELYANVGENDKVVKVAECEYVYDGLYYNSWTFLNGYNKDNVKDKLAYMKLTSKNNNKVLFIPSSIRGVNGNTLVKGRSGNFWSASVYTNSKQYENAIYGLTDNSDCGAMGGSRYIGFPIRAVLVQ